MKIATIIGARPQFIKAATVYRAISALGAQNSLPGTRVTEVIIHTGQHFDDNMSEVFFRELEIPKPDYNLGIGGGTHGKNTGRMIEAIEDVLVREKPDWVLVYGDTDSTLAGALAAAKLHIPVAHVEAGLRSYNRRMPEEINRVLTDHASDLLFAPTRTAVDNLRKEGFTNIVQNANLFQPIQPVQPSQHIQPFPLVINVGDVMYDAALFYAAKAEQNSRSMQTLGLEPKNFLLATIHRAENTDDPDRLANIMEALQEIATNIPVILPLHPRTRKKLNSLSTSTLSFFNSLSLNLGPSTSALGPGVNLVDPLGYLDMVMLEKNARVIITDSGGVQKEAYFHGVPCVTVRDETEWVELVEARANVVAGTRKESIIKAYQKMKDKKVDAKRLYGDGDSAEIIISKLTQSIIGK